MLTRRQIEKRQADPETALFPEDNWTAIFRWLPGYRLLRQWRPRSGPLFAAAAAMALTTAVIHWSFERYDDRFEREGRTVLGTVMSSGRIFLVEPRGADRDSGALCYVRYRFTPPGEASPRTAWRFWREACTTRVGANIAIEYVASDPSINRPDGSGGAAFLLKFLLWAVPLVVSVWALLQRRAEGRITGAGAHEVPAVVESVARNSDGLLVLTYSYEAGVRGRQFGRCVLDDDAAAGLKTGDHGRALVDPIHPARSDWLGLAS